MAVRCVKIRGKSELTFKLKKKLKVKMIFALLSNPEQYFFNLLLVMGGYALLS